MENNKQSNNLPLAPYRILDLSTDRGYVCGKLLAELGAEVIKVEPPEGDAGRNIGPFYQGVPDKEKSLFFFAYNTNKKSITLNIETLDGQNILKRLVKTADFIIESFDPGYLDKLGLGYASLQKINPRLIMVSVTPFGQTGPRKNWKASDITEAALSGLSYITGSPERPPVRISIDQSLVVAGYQAAMGAMIANYYAQATGKGQQVDTSIQESLLISALTVPQAWDLQKYIWPREGAFISRSGKRVRYLWACKDGHVAWRIFGGGLGPKTRSMVEWMESEGQAGELSKVEWTKMDYLSTPPEVFDRWQSIFASFFMTHTKAEICQKALDEGIVLLPASTADDLLHDRQLVARDFWQEVKHEELGAKIVYAGSSFKTSEYTTKVIRAPLIGEHNCDIYEKELGYSAEELAILKDNGII